ncbi:hypothetical protein GCM10008908_11090 [Clostridium subterminale]|uniref:Uncharacterized protein n=1 Tax=Clostridium subterminale TaxID=1550 RepID=A0ABN1KKT9_CLOSU
MELYTFIIIRVRKYREFYNFIGMKVAVIDISEIYKNNLIIRGIKKWKMLK